MAALASSLLQALHSLHGFSGKSLALLLDTVFRGTCLLLLCGVLVLTLRRASAAARHLVWSLGLGAMLALPFISLTLPAWDVPVITTWLSGTASKRNAAKEDSPVFLERSQIHGDDTARSVPRGCRYGRASVPSRLDSILVGDRFVAFGGANCRRGVACPANCKTLTAFRDAPGKSRARERPLIISLVSRGLASNQR